MTVLHPNYTYWTYTLLELVLPLTILALNLFYLVIDVLLYCCKNYCERYYFTGCFSDLIYPFVKVVFRRSLKKSYEDNDIDDNNERSPYSFQLHRCEIQKYDVLLLFPLTSWIISLAFFAFWDTFLIQQRYVCDPRLDCFHLANSIPYKSIDNCTHLNTTENVICFEFVFDVVGGFSSAVGVVGISVLYFNMNLTILNCLKRNHHFHCCRICYQLTVFIIIVLPCIIIGLGGFLVFNFFDFLEKSDLYQYRVLIYCTGFITFAIFSVVISCKIRLSIADFKNLRINQERLFNTHTNGYRMSVRGREDNGNVSIITHLIANPVNRHLSWPFGGEITIQIVNRDGDHHHITGTIHYNNDTPDGARRVYIVGQRSERFTGCIFTQNELQTDPGSNIRYWSNDQTLHLRVIKVKPNMSILNVADYTALGIDQRKVFITHTNGYRMSIHWVEQNGNVEIITQLLNNFNQHLSWPFGAEITIQIVNRDGDHDHITKIIRYNTDTPDGARRVEGDRSDEFIGCTFTQNALQNNPLPNRNIRYLDNNHALHLRVIRVKPNV